MSMCLGGMIFPYFSELLMNKDDDKFIEIINEIKRTAQIIQLYKPQVVVLLSPNGSVVDDAVTIHIQPRLKGNLEQFEIGEQVLGFETDYLLIKAILNQSNRLGIAMYELTNDFLMEYQLNDMLSKEALVPLYYLHKAGFKGQIVHLNYGNLFYEEMYTLGKVVQLAIDKVQKDAFIIVGTSLSQENNQQEKSWNQGVVMGLKELDMKTLLELAKNKPKEMKGCDFRALFFLLGSLSKLDFERKDIYYKEYLGKGQVVGSFTNN